MYGLSIWACYKVNVTLVAQSIGAALVCEGFVIVMWQPTGGMRRELIHSTPSFYGHERWDTVFVVLDLDDSKGGIESMEIGRVLLFFSFHYHPQQSSCGLITWFVYDEEPDPDTGL